MTINSKDVEISRRAFLKLSGVTIGGALLAEAGNIVNSEVAWADEATLADEDVLPDTEITYIPENELDSVATLATQNGWVKSGLYYYYYVNGSPVTGWKSIGGYWYYFGTLGRMQTGWASVGGHWYYLRKYTNDSVTGPEGAAIVSNWGSIDGYWYRFDSSGAMLTGWQKVGGSWYYLRTATNTPSTGPAGAMCVGWIYVDSRWYYLQSSGTMYFGWLDYNGYKYYLADSQAGVTSGADLGCMLKGFHKVGTYEYYFRDISDRVTVSPSHFPEGAMVYNATYSITFGGGVIIEHGFMDGAGHVTRDFNVGDEEEEEDTVAP